MDFTVRKAVMEDYESVVKIMNQVQQIHVDWRPDIYKLNNNLIPIDLFAKNVEDGTFFVAEADGIELVVNSKNKAAYEMYSKYGFTVKSINMELL